MNHKVAHLVNDHVIDAIHGGFYKVDVECDVACLGATPPAASHLADGNCESIREFKCSAYLLAQSQTVREDALCMIQIPGFQQATNLIGIVAVRILDLKESSNQFDFGFIPFAYFQTVLPTKVDVGLATDEPSLG